MSHPPDFICLSLSPGALSPPGIALATARAGGVGLLDTAFDLPERLDALERNLLELLRLARPDQGIGLRLTPAGLDAGGGRLLDRLAGRPHWLALAQWEPDQLAEILNRLPVAPGRRLLLEITDPVQVAAVQPHRAVIAGLIARGHESGGAVGETSAFVLAQTLLAAPEFPIYIQGAIGIHAAAACRAAGAAGVVLDDVLLGMPEAPLPEHWRARLTRGGAPETLVLSDRAPPMRVIRRPGASVGASRVGWGDPDDPDAPAWPVGQGIGQAAALRARYRTTGRFIQALLARSAAPDRPVLCPDSPLARAHGTRHPIVQGPMTRVSDHPAFAAAVARAGALPMLALALLPPDEVERLLTATRDLLGEQPWGVGLLGFIDAGLLEAQLAVVTRIRPRVALLAGGRPDQARHLERLGIPTYLHAPTPALARHFIDQGARRLILEGRECGGHVGPLGSFALWDAAVETLLETVPEERAGDVQILFAGGIHDGRSARMVETLAAPLAERGIQVGVLMGTAYLFTREAVETGAILPGFQRQALDCARTVTLETGPGHASRCADTPFARTFETTRQALQARGEPPEAIARALDDLCLGRLRIAAKGIARAASGLTPVADDDQIRDGMYMLGQVATLRDQVIDMETLHRAVCPPPDADRTEEASPAAPIDPADPDGPPPPDAIAIVGIGLILPKADTPEDFWSNILQQVDASAEIPPTRWDWRRFYDPDPQAPDRVYSKWGCFIDEIPFDPARFGIPPRALASIDPIQLLALEAVQRALTDAGYADGAFDRANTAVILGYSGGLGELGERYVARTELTARCDDPDGTLLAGLPEWTEDSFPGILPNVASGRVANRFDLGGANFTLDAACASSLTAIDVAVAQLASGRCNLAIAGGVDTKLSAFGYLCFSKTPALTPRDRAHPFDAAADGILLGEGVAVVVLKRLADAEADGDRIHAVLRGAASSSDGKALGLTAPRGAGQRVALERAYRQAGFGPERIGFYEAHGTGTRLGDETELHTLTELLTAHRAAPRACAVGAVKALIGHTKSTAGAAALVKAALALHHRTLPPQPGIATPLAALRDPASPVYLLQAARPWLRTDNRPRRAGVSAFGFGGTNCHCVLEEYRGALHPGAPGGTRWPGELILLAAADRAALGAEIERLRAHLSAAAPAPRLRDVAAGCARRIGERIGNGAARARLACVAADVPALLAALAQAGAALAAPGQPISTPALQFGLDADGADPPARGALAFLFPGQGAQYPDMGREVAVFLEPMRASLETADRVLAAAFPDTLSGLILPPGRYSEAEQAAAAAALTATAVAQPALGAVALGYLDLLTALGVRPDLVGGHSYGEYVALHAAGVLARDDLLRLSRLRGETMAAAGAAGDGAMAAVTATRDQVTAVLAGTGVVLANHNAPRQTVISGPAAAVDQVLARLETQGIAGRRLPVSGAFHSPLMRASRDRLAAALDAIPMAAPALPVFANGDGQPHPADPARIRARLAGHLLAPVEFVAQINAMHAAGARCFVEVGPKSILTALVGQILADRPHVALAVDGHGGGLRGLLMALGGLFVQGFALDADLLYRDRDCRPLAFDTPPVPQPAPDASRRWLLSGGGIRRMDEPPPAPPRIHALRPRDTRASLISVDDMPMTADTTPPADRPGRPLTPETLAAYQAYQETMRTFLTVQEQVMRQFLGGAERGALPLPPLPNPTDAVPAPAPAASEPPASPAPAPAPAPDVPDADVPDPDRLIATIQRIVSERTGYPPDMLGLDQALEADLGIDSIKRVEILAGIEGSLPTTARAALSARMTDLTRARTIRALSSILLEAMAAPAGVADPDPDPKPEPEPEPAPAPPVAVERHAMRARPAPLARQTPVALPGLVLIAQDEGSVGDALARRLRASGIAVGLLDPALLASPAGLAEPIQALRDRHGPVVRLVHLTGLGAAAFPDDLAAWRRMTALHVKSLFHLLRLCADDLRTQRGRILAASMLGGSFGRNGICGPGLPCSGGNAGLLKTIALEWPEVTTRIIDFATCAEDLLVDCLIDEIFSPAAPDAPEGPDTLAEIGYVQGARSVFMPVAEPRPAGGTLLCPPPAADWVVLALGGARGITAEIVDELLCPGLRLVIVGRGPEPGPEPETLRGITDPAALREVFIASARARHENPTPAGIDRAIRQLRRQRDIRAHLDRFAAVGAQVEYHALDVNDGAALGALIEDIHRRLGRLDAVIQGVGVIEDRLLLDKAPDSFDRVFDTKADSTYLLCRHLRPESLKFVLLFASVAGRTGNRGQADYAAANEVINRCAWWMHERWSTTRILSLNWGPWETTGMASEEVLRQFRARGVIPIPTAAGRRFARDELLSGDANTIELIAGCFEAPQPPVPPTGGDPNRRQPLLPGLIHPWTSGTLSLEMPLSARDWPCLGDHRLDGRPVLPAALAMELLAEFVQAGWPERQLIEVRDLRVLHGIVLSDDRDRAIRLEARPLPPVEEPPRDDPAVLAVAAAILDPETGRPCYGATCRLHPPPPPEPGIVDPEPLTSGQSMDRVVAYAEQCFHGPLFQILRTIDRIAPAGVDATGMATRPADWIRAAAEDAAWILDPGVVDALLQTSILWTRRHQSSYPLPARFGRVRRHGPLPPDQTLYFTNRIQESSPTRVISDFRVFDEDSRLLLEALEVEATHSAALNRLAPSHGVHAPPEGESD